MAKPRTRKDFEATIVANAWKDPKYQRRLLADPKGVVQSELDKVYKGATLPAPMNVHVHQEGPNDVHLVLPRNPQDFTPQELADDDLDQLAGGTGVGVVVTAVQAVIVNSAVNLDTTVNVNILNYVVAIANVTTTTVAGTSGSPGKQ